MSSAETAPERRTILIGGPCGAGKTSVAQLGVGLPYDERRSRLMFRQVAGVVHVPLDPPTNEIQRRIRAGDAVGRGAGRLATTFPPAPA